jgi:hypothetical protein
MNLTKKRRRWLAWCRYMNHYLIPGVTCGGRALIQAYNHSANRNWRWP